MTILKVPYYSQWSDTASLSKNDCGTTSLAMVLNYYGENTTSDIIFKQINAGQGYITFGKLQYGASQYGYSSSVYDHANLGMLMTNIDNGEPPIVVINYGLIPNRQDVNFRGSHIVAVVGYEIDHVFIHDPDYSNNGGEKIAIEYSVFDRAWAEVQDGNLPRTMLKINKKNKLPINNITMNYENEIKKLVEKMGGDQQFLLSDPANRIFDEIQKIKKENSELAQTINQLTQMNKALEEGIAKIREIYKEEDDDKDDLSKSVTNILQFIKNTWNTV